MARHGVEDFRQGLQAISANHPARVGADEASRPIKARQGIRLRGHAGAGPAAVLRIGEIEGIEIDADPLLDPGEGAKIRRTL